MRRSFRSLPALLTARKAAVAGLAAATVLSAVGLASAQSPSEAVHAARQQAQRSADVEGSLRGLESELRAEAGAEGRGRAEAIVRAARAFQPIDLARVPADWSKAGLDPQKAERVGDKLVQTLADGSKVTFTIEPEVQEHLEEMLDNYNVPHGGVVLIDPPTGRVLAMVSHTEHETPIERLSQKATAPSASVFKIVTAAALMESAGVNPQQETCYHGGRSRLSERNIKGDPRRDHKCADLGAALAWSINSIMAKLAYNKLSREDLAVWAEKFGYNTEIPFELPVEVSTAEFVEDPLERARAAAGFWHTYLSPLHGALIGAAVANDGVMMRPTLIDTYESAEGEVLQRFEPEVFRRVMAPETAKVLGKLMVQTTTEGTARRYFAHRGSFPNHIEASGKTGTLSNKDPYLLFTWFVGFATDPQLGGKQVAVSGLVCNTPLWRIKGPYAASEAVRIYFERLEERERSGDEVATLD